ncbi:APC family permease [Acidithiobacillus thiooxidans]|uniref:APC family permease n=1 Tax=Acidithiobacillus thiooxidans TaxID=930 RepID=UPI0002624BB5|nr:APC family permease [Acidithiobacillus thiooxidans]MBU2810168.1 APC family permease [Acidithiobacillus thiooxidans]
MPVSRKSDTSQKNALKREGGLVGLILACVGASIGSGWLFGPLFTAKMAGPLAIGSWILGAAAILLLALVFAELAPMIPRAGAVVHLAHVGNGPIVGHMWSWILFLSYASIAPLEVTAVLTYANNYYPGLLQPHTDLLSSFGFLIAVIMLGLFVITNFMVIGWVLRINNAATWWKIGIPLLTAVMLIAVAWHPGNFHMRADNTLSDVHGMFIAIASGGVIFSLLGFRHAIDLAGESKNPRRDVPIAVIGSVLIASAVYIAVQVAFLGAVNPADIAKDGWVHLHFQGVNGPFAALAAAVGIGWLATLLYVDAFISPAGTGLIYTTTAARVTLATAETGAAPMWLNKINRHGVPWVTLILLFLVGIIFFLPFPSWQKMVGYIASMTVLSYSIGPIALIQIRKAMPNLERPFRLWGAPVLAPIAFVVSTWIVYWSGLRTLNFIFITLFVLLAIYALTGVFRKGRWAEMGWQYMWWIFPYFIGMWVISWIGPKDLGGLGYLAFFPSMGALAVLALSVFYLAIRESVADKTMRVYMRQFGNKVPSAAP